MSYARFGQDDSDVYVFMHVGGFLTCCGCILADEKQAWGSFDAGTTQRMLDHLQKHIDAGDNVPPYVAPELQEDDKENFPDGS